MYAIIDNGNKQYKVAEGDVVRVEKLAANEGDAVSFNVLMVADENGVLRRRYGWKVERSFRRFGGCA